MLLKTGLSSVARPASVVVASRIGGLRDAMAGRDLDVASYAFVGDDVESPEAVKALAGCEILVGEPGVCAPLIERCPKLVWMQSTFAGCNPLLEVPRRDYIVTRLAGQLGADMAEYTALHVLALERGLQAQHERQTRCEWIGAREPGGTYRRLSSLTLGVLGLGDLGSEIARALRVGFGMRVVGCRRDPSPAPRDEASGVAGVYGIDALPDFLSGCDYVLSVLPSTAETRGLLDGDALAACASRQPRPPALINVGRGDLVSEAGVVAALDRGWISHYVGDVFVPEPLPAASPLWGHPKVTVTPHVSAITMPDDVAAAFADNLSRFEEGGVVALRHRFRWDAGY